MRHNDDEDFEISEFIKRKKTSWSLERFSHSHGEGFVSESVFIFDRGRAYWLVYIKKARTFAFKELNTDWIKVLSRIILASTEIFVEFDNNHRILRWSASQDKTFDR